jgi:hypothetical protein
MPTVEAAVRNEECAVGVRKHVVLGQPVRYHEGCRLEPRKHSGRVHVLSQAGKKHTYTHKPHKQPCTSGHTQARADMGGGWISKEGVGVGY